MKNITVSGGSSACTCCFYKPDKLYPDVTSSPLRNPGGPDQRGSLRPGQGGRKSGRRPGGRVHVKDALLHQQSQRNGGQGHLQEADG